MSKSRERDARVPLGWVMLAGGSLLVLFWTLYLTGAVELGQHDPLVSTFEAAFALADTVFGLVLVTGGWLLLRRDRRGVFFLVVAASMSLYLGLLDLAFYGRSGLYDSLTPSAVFELGLNLICIGVGAACLWFGWKLWRTGGAS